MVGVRALTPVRFGVAALIGVAMFALFGVAQAHAQGATVRIVTDAAIYAPGQNITATVMNDGPSQVSSGLGYPCGAIVIERWVTAADGWEELPTPDVACILIARILDPGQSFTQDDIPAPSQPGTYRLVYKFADEATRGSGSVASEPFAVVEQAGGADGGCS